MAPVRQATIGPMLVGRELEKISWEPVRLEEPRLAVPPDWLEAFRDFRGSQLNLVAAVPGLRRYCTHRPRHRC